LGIVKINPDEKKSKEETKQASYNVEIVLNKASVLKKNLKLTRH